MDISSLSSLPTDSLYKFMALCGLFVTTISIIFPEILKKRFNFQLYELRRDLEINKLYNEFYTKKIHDLKNLTQKKESEFKKKVIDGSDVDDKDEIFLKEICSSAEEIEKKAIEIKKVSIEIDCETKKLEFLSSQLKKISNYKKIGLFVGISMFIGGFFCWYTRLQVYIDTGAQLQTK